MTQDTRPDQADEATARSIVAQFPVLHREMNVTAVHRAIAAARADERRKIVEMLRRQETRNRELARHDEADELKRAAAAIARGEHEEKQDG